MSQKIDLLMPIMQQQPVIPVLVIDDVDHALPLARALVEGGLKVLEVTLRTAAALETIAIIARHIPQAVVGAGTVLNARDYDAASQAGAKFIVSPGLTMSLCNHAKTSPIPLLPGAITPGEMMKALENGYSCLKFFPAEQAGGSGFVKALASPFSTIRFCPTGGISAQNAPDWLQLSNVICVGGSWLAPKALVQAGDWDAITHLADTAAQLASFQSN